VKLSISELRSRPNSGTTQGKDNHPLVFVRRDELNKLLDIAEATRAMFETAAHDTSPFDFEFEGDRIEAAEQALAGVFE